MRSCIAAGEALAEMGINAEVIDLRTLRPLDFETIIQSVKRTNHLVCVDESWEFCSVASSIAAKVGTEAFDYLDAEIVTVCSKDVPMPYAANLEKMTLPQVEDIVQACLKILNRG